MFILWCSIYVCGDARNTFFSVCRFVRKLKGHNEFCALFGWFPWLFIVQGVAYEDLSNTIASGAEEAEQIDLRSLQSDKNNDNDETSHL